MIEIKSLSKSFGKLKIFNNFSISFKKNKIYSIYGNSGKGKTTLLRCIAGFEEYSGKIYLQDNSLGFLFQEDTTCSWLTVMENIQLPFKLSSNKGNFENKIYQLAEKLEISDLLNKKIYEVSGGQKQRILLLRELISGKKILLLDEPIKSLDKKLREKITKFLYSYLRKNKMTAIITTHEEIVKKYCDEVIEL